jgi:uncharacterized protein
VPGLFHAGILLIVSFIAATLAAVAGFGGAAILLPVLVATFGVREAIPILTVAQLWATVAACGSIARNWTGGL